MMAQDRSDLKASLSNHALNCKEIFICIFYLDLVNVWPAHRKDFSALISEND